MIIFFKKRTITCLTFPSSYDEDIKQHNRCEKLHVGVDEIWKVKNNNTPEPWPGNAYKNPSNLWVLND